MGDLGQRAPNSLPACCSASGASHLASSPVAGIRSATFGTIASQLAEASNFSEPMRVNSR